MRRAQLKVVKGTKRTDVCELCKGWDTEVAARVEKAIVQPFEVPESTYPGYFSTFHNPVPLGKSDGSIFERVGSPTYIQCLKA